MKIGEVSQESGVGVEALRFYERSGLLGRPARSQSGYRLYDEGVLERLAFIRKAQFLGFSLDEIRHIISDAEKGASPCDNVRAIVRRRLAEVSERIKEMQRHHRELTRTLEEWDEVGRHRAIYAVLSKALRCKTHRRLACASRRKSREKRRRRFFSHF
jgi:DNA-binding transcriptional MerR regulator